MNKGAAQLADKTIMLKILLTFTFLSTISSCMVSEDSGRTRPLLSGSGSYFSSSEKPSGAITIEPGFCACNTEGIAVNLGNCTDFCSSQTNIKYEETLFIDTILGTDITLHPKLGSLYNWCTLEMLSEDGSGGLNPTCVIEYYDETSTIKEIEVSIEQGATSFQVDITGLEYDKTFVMSLKETGSGAISNFFQVQKTRPVPAEPDLGPLAISSVNRYSCIARSQSDLGNGSSIFDAAYRLTYFYSVNDPAALPAGTDGIFCHDITQTPIDNPFLPRLELKFGDFTIWSPSEPRFYDNDGNQQHDINDIIKARLEYRGVSYDSTPQIFQVLNWPSQPILSNGDPTESESEDAPILGFIMRPFIDSNSYKGYCPTSEHYFNSDNILFEELGELVGVDTEGLYLAKSIPETQTDSNGNPITPITNFILIRESMLKQIWFYTSGALKITPDDSTVRNRTIYFYWPANTSAPHVKSANQNLYQLTYSGDTSDSGTDLNSPYTGAAPHDKRIGCVPKTN